MADMALRSWIVAAFMKQGDNAIKAYSDIYSARMVSACIRRAAEA